MPRHPLRATWLFLLALPAVACREGRAPAAPPVAFLVAAGDSTFLVESGQGAIGIRRSGLLLARLDGAFHEVYIADEDLSYQQALLVGQRVFRRDLQGGDSVQVRYDSTIVRHAMAWAARHPDDRPLAPDEETSEEPQVQATTDTELLDAVGPYLSYEFHLDEDIRGARDQHVTRRGVVDLRDGRAVTLYDLLPPGDAARVTAAARERFAAAVDSVRHARDERATRARSTLAGFAFDTTSFELVVGEEGPAVSFLVPGRGPRAGGYSLPLGEIEIPPGAWWTSVAPTLPATDARGTATWADSSYDVIATVATDGESAALAVRHGTRDWEVGTVPLPVRRVFRLALAPSDAQRRAITRAFDDADALGGATQPTAWIPWSPRPHAPARRSSPTS